MVMPPAVTPRKYRSRRVKRCGTGGCSITSARRALDGAGLAESGGAGEAPAETAGPRPGRGDEAGHSASVWPTTPEQHLRSSSGSLPVNLAH